MEVAQLAQATRRGGVCVSTSWAGGGARHGGWVRGRPSQPRDILGGLGPFWLFFLRGRNSIVIAKNPSSFLT